MPTFDIQPYQQEQQKTVDEYSQAVQGLYDTLIQSAAFFTLQQGITNTAKPFQFKNYPRLNNQINALLERLRNNVESTIVSGQAASWRLSNAKNDALVGMIVGEGAPARYLDRNQQAFEAFQSRKRGGLGLSQRVFKYSGAQLKSELELALDIGLLDGKSAAALSRDVRRFLVEPDKLFRRVRNERGVLHLSQNAKNYKPRQGVYRSSYKNAMRLSRTEIQQAYHTADYTRYQQLDFVVGIEVRLSNRRNHCPMCIALAGRYPKTYVFSGNHPNCTCYTVTILATPAEREVINQAILEGRETSGIAKRNNVTDVHDGYKQWISENRERLLRANSVPYIIQQNYKGGKFTGGLRI